MFMISEYVLEWSGDYQSDPDLPSRWRKCI